jgi:hypothetical protein
MAASIESRMAALEILVAAESAAGATVPVIAAGALAPTCCRAGDGDGAGVEGRLAGAHALTTVNAIHVATARARLECVMLTSSGA